jgi:hypothetical protein
MDWAAQWHLQRAALKPRATEAAGPRQRSASQDVLTVERLHPWQLFLVGRPTRL